MIIKNRKLLLKLNRGENVPMYYTRLTSVADGGNNTTFVSFGEGEYAYINVSIDDVLSRLESIGFEQFELNPTV